MQHCRFERWTLAHGHFARMGGFTIPLPSDVPYAENGKYAKSASFRPQHLLRLLERQGRFDVLQGACGADITRVHDATWTGVLKFFILRLCPFAYYSIRRRSMGLEISPLEVVTVASVFLAICTQFFWWHKPQYLRKGLDLDIDMLCESTEGLREELEARARGIPIAEAYNKQSTMPIRLGFIQWHQQDDNNIDLRIHANYRDMIVFGLSTCHSILLLLPYWGLTFASDVGRRWWHFSLQCSASLSGILFILMTLDLLGRLCGWIKDAPPPEPAAYVRKVIHDGLPIFATVHLTVMVVIYTVTVLELQSPSRGILVAGPGDNIRSSSMWI